MKPELYQPIWIKAVLGFVLFMLGLLFTFLVFRFIPISKKEGVDGLGGLLIVLFCLAGFEVSVQDQLPYALSHFIGQGFTLNMGKATALLNGGYSFNRHLGLRLLR